MLLLCGECRGLLSLGEQMYFATCISPEKKLKKRLIGLMRHRLYGVGKERGMGVGLRMFEYYVVCLQGFGMYAICSSWTGPLKPYKAFV